MKKHWNISSTAPIPADMDSDCSTVRASLINTRKSARSSLLVIFRQKVSRERVVSSLSDYLAVFGKCK